jgi:hypothetical protein
MKICSHYGFSVQSKNEAAKGKTWQISFNSSDQLGECITLKYKVFNTIQ